MDGWYQRLAQTRYEQLENKYAYFDPIKVVYSQDSTSLIFITDEAVAFWFSSFLVSNKIDIDNLSIPEISMFSHKMSTITIHLQPDLI